jgi:DNA-binding protein HU-beta
MSLSGQTATFLPDWTMSALLPTPAVAGQKQRSFTITLLAFRTSIGSKPPATLIKETMMTKMSKSQLIAAISESSTVSKNDVKAVIENMATVGYKELNVSGEFVIPGFVKMSVINKPATEARSGINPFTKEPMEFAAKPASKTVKASPLKAAKDAV